MFLMLAQLSGCASNLLAGVSAVRNRRSTMKDNKKPALRRAFYS
jgi:hypothetical protein